MFHARVWGSVNQQEFCDRNGTRLIYTSRGSCPRSSNGKIYLHYSVTICISLLWSKCRLLCTDVFELCFSLVGFVSYFI